MFDKSAIKIRKAETLEDIRGVYYYVAKNPEASSFVDGVPDKDMFEQFFLNNAHNVLYIVTYKGKYVGYGYIEYETYSTGKCHWGLAEYTPYFLHIVMAVFEYIKETTTLKTFLSPISKNNIVAKKIAKRCGYHKILELPKYYDDADFELWAYQDLTKF